MSDWLFAPFGEVTFEGTERRGDTDDERPVYGVDRHEGLTPSAKYQSKDLSKYKVLMPGMFAYNPMRLNIGSIAYCTEDHGTGLVSPDYVVFGCDEKQVDPEFFKYLIGGPEWVRWTRAAGVGSVRVRIYFKELARMPLSLPPLSAQRAIASVLGALDDKIELNRRMNATLESMARALFQSWFVDFDAVRAKLDGRQPIGMDAKTAELFPTMFEDSHQGTVPAGWRPVPLTDIYEIRSGLSKPRAEFGFGYPFLTFTNVMNNTFIPQTLTALVNSNDSERNECSVQRGDVFLTRTSETQEELGMSCVALDDYSEATFNGFTKRLRPIEDSPLSPEYSGFYFRSARFRRDVTAMSSLSTRASLNNDMLAMLTILVPPKLVCDSFAEYVCPLLRKVQANSQQSDHLATLRDTLLPKLLSGELSVAGIEKEAVV